MILMRIGNQKAKQKFFLDPVKKNILVFSTSSGKLFLLQVSYPEHVRFHEKFCWGLTNFGPNIKPSKKSFYIERVMYFRVMYPYLVMYPYFPKLFNQKWFCYIMSTFAQKRSHSIVYMIYNIWINYCTLLNVNGC